MSTLAFYKTQLTALDKKIHEPLYSVTFQEDIKLREDVSIGNEATAYIRSKFAAGGTQEAQGDPWITANTRALLDVGVDGEQVVAALRFAGHQISYNEIELARSMQLGMPIDVQKYAALKARYQMHADKVVYIGDKKLGFAGLVNSPVITSKLVENGAAGSPLWVKKTPKEILKDVNSMLNDCWVRSAQSVFPRRVLLPTSAYTLVASTMLSDIGEKTILTFLKQNNITTQKTGVELEIEPRKFLDDQGVGGAARMVAYTNDIQFVRFPMVPIITTGDVTKDGFFYKKPYIWGLGEVEFPQPETLIYRDGI